MSLFGSMMRDMEHDPIFGAHSRAMNQMNRMMNSFFGGSGFGGGMMGGMGGMGMLESPFGGMNGMGQGHGQELMGFPPGIHQIAPFGQMPAFPDFNDMMRTDGNGHSFSSMSVTSITSGPDGRPQVYQASNQTAIAPGGVKETRKAVADSRTGTKKLAVGRHVGDRGHVRERMENVYTGQREESEDLLNLDETEAESFDREWRQRAYGGRYSHSASMPAITGSGVDHHLNRIGNINTGRHHQEISYHHSRPSDPTPSVTIEELPPSDDEDLGRNSAPPPFQASASTSSSRRSPYTREKKQKSKRVKKH